MLESVPEPVQTFEEALKGHLVNNTEKNNHFIILSNSLFDKIK